MADKILTRGDSTSNWGVVVPTARELVIDTTKKSLKIGDGVTAFNALPAVTAPYTTGDALKVIRVKANEIDLEVGVVLGNSATKDTGTSGSTVALGNHTHTGVYEPILTKTASAGKIVQVNATNDGLELGVVLATTFAPIAANVGLVATSTPASAGATGTLGQITYDGTYVYLCIATNTWLRAELEFGTWS